MAGLMARTAMVGWVLGMGLVTLFGVSLPACAVSTEDDDALYDDGEGADDSIDPLAGAGRWKLSPNVRSVGATMFVTYDNGPSWSPKLCAGGLKPGAKKLGAFLDQKFSQISSIQGYSCRANTASPTKMSIHGTGRALDIFIPMSGGAADNTKGDEVANYLVTHAEELQVQYIIWDRSQWRANGTNDRLYAGPVPHTDHLHVEITNEAATLTAPWYK
jgi:hypothetical protein